MKPTKAVSTYIIHDDIMKAFNIHRKYRSSHPEVFLEKDVLKICSKFTGDTHAEVWLKYICKATLFKSHFGMGILLYICCIFSKNL